MTTVAVIPTLSRGVTQLMDLTEALRALDVTPVLVVNGRRLHDRLEHDQVDHVTTMTNPGFSASIGHGLEAADPSWQWLMIVNDDVHLDPTALRPELDAARSGGSDERTMTFLDPEPMRAIPRVRDVFTSVSLLGALRKRAGAHRSHEDAGYKSFSCVIISRALWEDLGGLDRSFTYTYEDADFTRRARRAGSEVRQSSGVGVRHEGSSSGRRYIRQVLPVSVGSARAYLVSRAVHPFPASALLALALVIRLPLVLVTNAPRLQHLQGVFAAFGPATGRRSAHLPDFESC